MPRLIHIFIKTAALLLLVTGTAKIIGSTGNAGILSQPDPVLIIPFQQVFGMVGILEMVIAAYCLAGRNPWCQASCIAWLSTAFVLYRFGLLWVGYHKPCACLGTLTDTLHLSPHIADLALKIIVAYLLVGGYGCLLLLRLKKTP